MNYLRAYTPRIRPLNYDSLRSEIGCRTIMGAQVNQLLPFTTECVYSYQPDATFDHQGLVATFLGPANHLVPIHPYTTTWSAWQASTTIRLGQFSTVIPPSNSLGEESRLFAGTIALRLSAAFNRNGLLAIAIQEIPGTIKLRRYTDNLGTISETSFSGDFPALIYMGLVFLSELPVQSEVACYYLRLEKPGIIFVRMESDGFAMERQVNNEIRARPISWLYATTEDRMITLRGRDDRGRFLLYKTNPFKLFSTDTIGVGATITGGEYYDAAVLLDAESDGLGIGATITAGSYFRAITEQTDEIVDVGNTYSQTGTTLTRNVLGTRDFDSNDLGKIYRNVASPFESGIITEITDIDEVQVDTVHTFTDINIRILSALSKQGIGVNVTITSGEYELTTE